MLRIHNASEPPVHICGVARRWAQRVRIKRACKHPARKHKDPNSRHFLSILF